MKKIEVLVNGYKTEKISVFIIYNTTFYFLLLELGKVDWLFLAI